MPAAFIALINCNIDATMCTSHPISVTPGRRSITLEALTLDKKCKQLPEIPFILLHPITNTYLIITWYVDFFHESATPHSVHPFIIRTIALCPPQLTLSVEHFHCSGLPSTLHSYVTHNFCLYSHVVQGQQISVSSCPVLLFTNILFSFF